MIETGYVRVVGCRVGRRDGVLGHAVSIGTDRHARGRPSGGGSGRMIRKHTGGAAGSREHGIGRSSIWGTGERYCFAATGFGALGRVGRELGGCGGRGGRKGIVGKGGRIGGGNRGAWRARAPCGKPVASTVHGEPVELCAIYAERWVRAGCGYGAQAMVDGGDSRRGAGRRSEPVVWHGGERVS